MQLNGIVTKLAKPHDFCRIPPPRPRYIGAKKERGIERDSPSCLSSRPPYCLLLPPSGKKHSAFTALGSKKSQ